MYSVEHFYVRFVMLIVSICNLKLIALAQGPKPLYVD